MMGLQHSIMALIEAVGGDPHWSPTAGREDRCPPWWTWDQWRQVTLWWVLSALLVLQETIGAKGEGEITSMYRCDGDPDGARQSRHYYMDGVGKPFGAVDWVPPSRTVDWLRDHHADVPDIIRAYTGWTEGVGLLVYPSGKVHLDLRRRSEEYTDGQYTG